MTLAAVLLAGCVTRAPLGHDVPRPWAAPGIAVGSSREADIRAVYGDPTRRTENSVAEPITPAQAAGFRPYTNVLLTYVNGDRITSAFPAQLGSRLRITTFRLREDVLVGYGFTSPFPADSRAIDFDRGETVLHSPGATLPDLVALFGPPQSRQTGQTIVIAPSPGDAPGRPAAETRRVPSPAPLPRATVRLNTVQGEADSWVSTVRDDTDRPLRTETLVASFGPGGTLLRYTRSANSTLR